MLNRRFSEYLFYGILLVIGGILVALRVLIVGSLETKIEEYNNNNISLQLQIDSLEALVQDNKNIQTSHLYELYDIIPNVYSEEILIYKTVAMLEQLGVDESNDYNRTVYVNQQVSFSDSGDFYELSQDYHIVRVEISFTTDDLDIVRTFIDTLFTSEQLFIIESVSYDNTTNTYSSEMQISFLAIYDVEIEES